MRGKIFLSRFTAPDCGSDKINRGNILKCCSVIMVLFLLPGCMMSQKARLAESSTDYNLVVEKAQNEMLLLNIVRASKRHPMYFTAITQVRGSMEYIFQTGAMTVPFGKLGEGLNGSYSVAPNMTYSTKPSFDLAVMQDEKFMRGILNPVSPDMLYYYWEQGWTKEMLLLLFIEKIEFTDKSRASLDNYPGDKKNFEEFQNEIRRMIKCHQLEIADTKDEVGPPLTVETVKDVRLLVEAQKDGLKIEGNKETGFQVKKDKKDYIFKCIDPTKANCSAVTIKNDTSSGDKSVKSNEVIHLRSPEGIVYYLGEIMRAQKISGHPEVIIDKDKGCNKENLFVVDRFSPYSSVRKYSVTVDYEGFTYGIPQDPPADSNDQCTDRSMQALSLVAQLIGLHKSVEQMPVTKTVNVVGQ